MLSRALSLATVMLLIGCFAADSAQAQATNLEAGKSPSQIFAGTCTACHKSPRGLLKTVAAGSLPGFLRQHYTTSSEMAGLLSSFLVSNGATDTRYVGSQAKPGDAKTDAKPGGPPEQLDRQGRRLHPSPSAPPQEAAQPETQPQQAAKPDADGLSQQGETGRHGRNAKRLARPGEAPDGAKPGTEGQPPVQAEGEPDSRRSRLKLGKRGKPGSEEPPKTDAAKQEPGEPVKDDKPKSETAKDEGGKPEGDKPSGQTKPDAAKSESAKSETSKSETSKSETGKVDAPKATGGETPVLRADPVPPVTPAPKSAEGETHPMQTATPAPPSPAATSGAAVTGTAEPPAPLPAVTASAPPPAPVAPAGPPAPPISQ
jgi:hypothetical protein